MMRNTYTRAVMLPLLLTLSALGGGACTNVRPTGTDWDEGTCDGWATETEECDEAWMVDNNYCNMSCGRC